MNEIFSLLMHAGSQNPRPDNPGIDIFGFRIYYYAIIIVIGMLVAILIATFLFKKRGMNPDDLMTYALAAIPFGVLGARLFFFLFPYAGTTSDWSQFFNFRNGGLAIYGGVIGGAATVFVVSLLKKQNFFQVADCCIVGVIIAQSIGRWGNFVNQEAHGAEITNPAWQWFPIGVNISGTWYQATFFYESFWNLIGFAFLLVYSLKWYRKGMPLCIYGLYYGLGRFWIEGLRTDSLFLGNTGIRVSQFVSIIMMLLGLAGAVYIYRKELKRLWYRLLKKPLPEAAQEASGIGTEEEASALDATERELGKTAEEKDGSAEKKE